MVDRFLSTRVLQQGEPDGLEPVDYVRAKSTLHPKKCNNPRSVSPSPVDVTASAGPRDTRGGIEQRIVERVPLQRAVEPDLEVVAAAPGVVEDAAHAVAEAGISLRKSRWDDDLATPYGLRVSPGVSERRKSRYPLGLREKHTETERSGGSYAFSRAVVLTFPAGPTAFAYNGDRPPGDLSLWLPMVDGEDRRRDPMASGLSVIIPLTHNFHDYAMGSKHYAGPYVTRVGPYNHAVRHRMLHRTASFLLGITHVPVGRSWVQPPYSPGGSCFLFLSIFFRALCVAFSPFLMSLMSPAGGRSSGIVPPMSLIALRTLPPTRRAVFSNAV